MPKDMHSYFCCCARRVGNMFILMEYADGTPIVIAGPCWPFCMGVTLPLVLGISILVAYFLVLNEDSGLVCWRLVVLMGCVLYICILTQQLSLSHTHCTAILDCLYILSMRRNNISVSFLRELSRSWSHGTCDG